MNRPYGMHRTLANMPRQGAIAPKEWLRPTFIVTRSFFHDGTRNIPLQPVYIAVLSVDPDADTGTFEVLGSTASPSTVSLGALRTMLEQRGVKQ